MNLRNGNIGFGLVGIGMSGGFMAKELNYVEGAELVGVCSRNETEVRRFARTHQAKHWFTDYRHLAEHDDVDVVIVSAPTGLHAEMTIAASNAGKHALVEKPLETTLERADEMIAVCRSNQTKLGVVFQMRFGVVARTLKEAVESGRLGRVFLSDAVDKSSRSTAYYSSAAWRGTKALEGGGCLMTQSIHIIDLLQYLMGPARSVMGRVATRYHNIEVEDTATAVITFTNGAMGIIESTSSVRTALKSRIELHGELGTVVANAQYDQFLLWDIKGDEGRVEVAPNLEFTDIDDPWAYPQTRHRVQLQDMVDAIREDRDPVLTGEDARVSLAIISAIYDSSRLGKEVFLDSYRPKPPIV
ncbi:MAG: Gfo/Idh/MocA family oxidoreductase [Acidimicrobiia bacterium]|nr:Gfo/Idh/MocA family oxidoreductase [bacterium]MXX65025.1 Gfo/Idh/MocA family oxidoreductase [Acidimicrobiia bacterium]MCY3580333.1 Gfo/Idh/MocA family oxidoreductase [bacterium]MCY3653121.1 Gfo/Idh/MocA family oxidoreductase [bacterium]MDE0643633.1 Gfo/Idh/MocA family oxidoreductase [bacterium]